MTDLVNVECEGNILQDAVLPPEVLFGAAVSHFDSEGWFVCDQVIFLCVLCLLEKQHAIFM